MRAGTCSDVNAAPSAKVPMGRFLGSDGARFLAVVDQGDVICIDGASGNELWRKKFDQGSYVAWVSGGAYLSDRNIVIRVI
ncbi:hypothetical protein ATO49_07645 [Mycolicibacterium fortuitum subsp. fortuitum DSM 46621 = ATCC 6841 = JCM 6387]|nr:hypothetical protein ATO49_07645 [Mycolicibacterium fortuitum subsp. fortuitum DSM 46621 = ATCC 6841 = JCM 6387]